MSEYLEQVDWPTAMPWLAMAITFLAGWLLGRRGSVSVAAGKIAKSLNRIAAVLEQRG